MADWSQFEEMKVSKPTECAVCEAMCPDAVDGTLNEAERRVFEGHVSGCAACAKELEEAQRGAAWLGMLKGHTPEPPAALLAKILAETTGVESLSRAASVNPLMRDEAAHEWDTQSRGEWGTQDIGNPAVVPVREAAPGWALSSVWRKTVAAFRVENARATFQPRMAMTAAMAFVSLALTLNLTGVRLGNLRAASFTPAAVRRAVTDASASASRSFQSLRVVYQVESRVSELRGEGPLADRADQANQANSIDQSPAFAGQQPSNGAATDNGIVRRPPHKGL
ncbi:MAG TPA: zf-HC2 domain-containing protein [Acidobacteriaceae bacterium]